MRETISIGVIHGGPGLSASYLMPFKEACSRNGISMHFHEILGSGTNKFGSRPTFEETIEDIVPWIHSMIENGVSNFMCHSWGTLLLFASLNKIQSESINKVLLCNPVPLDRENYDHVCHKLMTRVKPDIAEQMALLLNQKGDSSGHELMRLAWNVYTPEWDAKPPVDFDYCPSTFNSVSETLGDFNYWKEYDRISNRCMLVFANNDYILEDDFRAKPYTASHVRLVDGGHFPFIEDPHMMSKIVEDWFLG